MRIPSLPECVKALPFKRRQKAMQKAVNAELHSRSICPIMQYNAGPSEPTVGVYRDTKGHFWYTTANGEQNEDRERFLEEIAVEAIGNMRLLLNTTQFEPD